MQTLRLLLLLSFCTLSTLPAQGQSLIEDTRALVAALQGLKAPEASRTDTITLRAIDTVLLTTITTPEGDSLARDTVWKTSIATRQQPAITHTEMAAQALAILYYYDTPNKPAPLTLPQFQSITQQYADNPMIKSALGEEGLLSSVSASDTTFLRRFNEKLNTLHSSPRQKMVSFLRSEEAVTPSAYLSVSKSLRKNSRPALEGMVSLRKAAGQSNKNVTDGLVSAPAFIEGLFNFVLSRAQEEVAISFLERLLGEEVQLLPTLFPTVSRTFKGHNFTYSTSFIERLRTAFYEDMQLLPVRLPELMMANEYFAPLRQDPVAYNLLVTFYTAGLAQKGMALDSFLPITNRYMYNTYEEARKKVDQSLTQQYQTAEYQAVIATTVDILGRMDQIHNRLVSEELALRDTIDAFLIRYDETAGLGLLDDKTLRNPDLDYSALMDGTNDSLGLGLRWLPDMLQGRLDSNKVLLANTLEYYDKFFAREYSPEHWRSAGLSLARNLNGDWRKGYTIPELLSSRRKALATYKISTQKWIRETDPTAASRAELDQAEQTRVYLSQSLLPAMQRYWSKANLATQDQLLALRLLNTIAAEPGNFYPTRRRSTLEDSLSTVQSQLLQLESRLITLSERLETEQPEAVRNGNPIKAYLASQQPAEPYAYIQPMIDSLSQKLSQLDAQLNALDRQRAGTAAKARDNAKPILQTTEILTQLFFCLRSPDEDRKWITRSQLNTIMDGGLHQEVFFGLMQQRLLDLQPIGRFSPNGFAQLLELTLQEWPLLADSLGREYGNQDTLAFYRKATLVANTFNRILELPLLAARGAARGTFLPLVQQDSALSVLPDLSRQSLDLVYFLSTKDHRHAVSSSIRLFTVMDEAIARSTGPKNMGEKDKRRKKKTIVSFFRNYGDFVADLIDADTTEKVTALMNGIADPPGSSRLKRTNDFTVSLNAYLGGSAYLEWWNSPETNTSDRFLSGAPTMPIGVSASALLGRNNSSSFSIFLSLLDLGSLLAYTDGSRVGGESKVSFKNVFKPGLQLHYNIPKTPFFMGVGAHYGPHYLDSAATGNELSVRSIRFSFFNIGIDVPIKTLYWSMN